MDNGKPDISAVKRSVTHLGTGREVSMFLAVPGWIGLFFSHSLRWADLHPALSSAFMLSPPSLTWAVGIWPLKIGPDPGEIKMPSREHKQGGSNALRPRKAIGQPPLVELWHCVAYWNPHWTPKPPWVKPYPDPTWSTPWDLSTFRGSGLYLAQTPHLTRLSISPQILRLFDEMSIIRSFSPDGGGSCTIV
jgi:hypothetical protein